MTEGIESVKDFYKNQSILITGGAGSLGKVLIEKLLRSCSDISNIYLLLRPKKHLTSTPSERLSEALDTALFSKLRKEKPGIFSKIVVVNGDLNLPNLGISKRDEETLINNVSIVFHCASVLKFDATLKQSLAANVTSTLRFLLLCRRMKKIQAFIYVSTLYSTCNHPHIEERLPVIECLKGIADYEKIDEDDLVKLLPTELVEKWPNTYTLSKAVTEIMINHQKDSLPISIVRPSIILSTMREPFSGWIDNFYGPTLMMLNLAIGIARSISGHFENVGDLIPSDIVVNLLICAARKTAEQETGEMKIYNCGSGKRNPVTWSQLLVQCQDFLRKNPSTKIVRYPYSIQTRYVSVHRVITAIQEYLIAYIHVFITGDSKVLRLQRTVTRYWRLVLWFVYRGWTIDDRNVVGLIQELNETDRKEFLFDVEAIDWRKYIENYARGIRVHLLEDGMDSVDEARVRLNKLWWKEMVIQVFLLLLMIGFGYIVVNILVPILISPFRNRMEYSSMEL